MNPMTETAKLEALIGRLNDVVRHSKECRSVIDGGTGDENCTCDAVATLRDVTRALSVSRPAVKGLRWADIDSIDFQIASGTVVGAYHIIKKGEAFLLRLAVGDGDPEKLGKFDTLEAAKAAAQSDFEQRILSSLSPPTGGEFVPVGEFIASSHHGVGVKWGDLGPLMSGDKLFARLPSPPEEE